MLDIYSESISGVEQIPSGFYVDNLALEYFKRLFDKGIVFKFIQV